MLTATSEKDRVVTAVQAGVDDYLSKPFQPKELASRVIALIRKIKEQGATAHDQHKKSPPH